VRTGPVTARPAGAVDALALYRWAVQDPETHATLLRILFQRLNPGHTPRILREDFAGTSAEAVAWLALDPQPVPGRLAVAVDRDPATLAWARRRAANMLGSRAARLSFITADVMAISPPVVPPADIISVLNFSILYLREPAALQAYLRHARECLASPGVLVMNLFGGSRALAVRTDRQLVTPRARRAGEPVPPPFEYQWEQRQADPGTRRLDCRIHFRVPDPAVAGGVRELRDAFHYDWRLWTLSELSTALRAAGFDEVQVWRHTHDPALGAQGVFLGAVSPESFESRDLWTAYVVARRGEASPPSPLPG
jgi:SAM-dependent methyltransferase